MMRRSLHALVLVFLAILPSGGAKAADTPIYVWVASHNERSYKDLGTLTEYLEYRDSLLKVLKILKSHGAAYHHGSDVTFLDAVTAFDVKGGTHLLKTNGKNIVRYLVEDLGFGEDPHAHETTLANYADVALKIRDLLGGDDSVIPTIANGADVFGLTQYNRFKNGTTAVQDATFSWKPTILYGPGIPTHNNCLERNVSGMWHPKGVGHDYFEHESTEMLTVIGQGFRAGSGAITDETLAFASAADYIKALAFKIKAGKAPPNKVYTAMIFFNEQKMKEQGLHEALDRELRKLSPLVKSGQVVFKQIGDIAELWKKDYAEEGNLYDAVTFTAFREWKSLNCGE
jgi:hypothetical protein